MSSESVPPSWEDGKAEEEIFWARWIETRGSEWPEEFRERMDPGTELQPAVSNQLNVPEERTPIILDVGAGPMTILGKMWRGTPVTLVAVDPLASTYDRLLAQFGVVPPVRTITGHVERLSESLETDFFDLVHMRNALDHSYDPLEGIKQMLSVAKTGAPVVLQHARNEAERENYVGFHQWNIDERGGRMILWNRSTTIDVHEALGSGVHLTVEGSETMVACTIRKSFQPAFQTMTL